MRCTLAQPWRPIHVLFIAKRSTPWTQCVRSGSPRSRRGFASGDERVQIEARSRSVAESGPSNVQLGVRARHLNPGRQRQCNDLEQLFAQRMPVDQPLSKGLSHRHAALRHLDLINRLTFDESFKSTSDATSDPQTSEGRDEVKRAAMRPSRPSRSLCDQRRCQDEARARSQARLSSRSIRTASDKGMALAGAVPRCTP